MSRLTTEQQAAIITRAGQGEAPRALAAEFGCSETNVRQLYRRSLLPPKPRRPHGPGGGRQHTFPTDQRAAIVARYAAGEPVCDLAREFGVAEPTVYLWIREKEGRYPGNPSPAPQDRVFLNIWITQAQRAWLDQRVGSRRVSPFIRELLAREMAKEQP